MSDESKPIGDLLKDMLEAYRLDAKLEEVNLAGSWKEIAGELIARHTRSVKINGSTLMIYVGSPALRNELKYHRSLIIEKVNKHLGSQRIKDVLIR